MGAGQRRLRQIRDVENTGPQPVIDIVIDVGDIVGQGGDLRFQPGPAIQLQRPARVEPRDRSGHVSCDRPIVFDQAFQRFPGQVQAVEIGVAMLQLGYQPEGMGVVVEAADILGYGVQRVFPGMAEGRVAEVMRQRHRLGQVFVYTQGAGQAAGDLGHFQGMGQAGAIIIAFMFHKDLGLVLQAAEGGGMDDAVAVPAIAGAGGAFGFRVKPAPAFGRMGGIGRQGTIQAGGGRFQGNRGLCGRHGRDYIRCAAPHA